MSKRSLVLMKKQIANIVTGSRGILSVPLLFLPLSSVWFYTLYLFCGLTDMVDGRIARMTGAANRFGARLDTVSDFIFLLVCSVRLLPILQIPKWLWIWIALIALSKIFMITLVAICKKRFISIHSVLNKITGLSLFLLPLTLTFIKTTYSVATICVLATIVVLQELGFMIKGRDLLSSDLI